MDLLTHAVVGAAAGATVGQPFAGLVAGVAPDIVLGIRRRASPNTAYKLTHSLTVCVLLALPMGLLFGAWGVLLGWFSHIFLDTFTHGDQWAPRPIYPLSDFHFKLGVEEWEFFNTTWFLGLFASAIMVILCVQL